MKFTIEWLKAALIRALRTVAQTALGMITVGMAVTEIDWMNMVSVSIVAAIYSILTSIITDLPEVEGSAVDGTLLIDKSDENTDKYLFNIDQTNLDELSSKDVIKLKVDSNAKLED